jgi:hypothetical protein
MSGKKLVVLVAFFVLASALPDSVRGQETLAKEMRDRKYRQLIAHLVSPNKPPETGRTKDRREGFVRFPQDYDKEAQARVNEARKALSDNFDEALPFLVEALDDQRYCMTIVVQEQFFQNYSVGQVCRNVIASHIEVYRDQLEFWNARHWRLYDYPISKEWWRERQERTVADLQLEAIDWAIAKRQSDEIWTEKRESGIRALRKLREDLSETKKTLPSGRLHSMMVNNYPARER